MKWKPTLNAFTITFTGRLERTTQRLKPPDHTHRLSDRPHLEHGTARRGVWVNSASVCPCGFYGRAACWPGVVWGGGVVVGSRGGGGWWLGVGGLWWVEGLGGWNNVA